MNKKSRFNRMLLLSASIPAAALLANAGGALAAPATVSVPTGAGTGAAVNADIATAITTPANPDLTVTIASGADISGASVGYDFVAGGFAAGQGDGAVNLTNDGRVTGLSFGGVGAASAANSFTATNNGEVVGGVSATDFGGAVSVTNNGTVGGSVVGSGFGDVTLANGLAGEVGGSLIGQALDAANVSITNAGTVDGDLDGSATTGTVSIANSGDVAGSAFASTSEGAISVTNAASGRISGDVSAGSESGAITIANNGQVLGQTDAFSRNTTFTSTGPTTTVSGTTTTTQSSTSQQTVGGDIDGTYAGINGSLNFGAGNDGSITQVSGTNSTATVTGTVYGDIYSEASGSSFATQNVAVSTDSRDAAGTGTVVNSSNNSFDVASTGGTSTVNISGTVAPGDSGRNGDVTSRGDTASAVNIAGGKVSGNVSSTSQGVAFNGAFTSEDTDTYDAGVFQGSTSVSGTQFNQARAGGDASVSLQGSSLVNGNVSVVGGASASAAIGSAAKIGQDVFVSTAVPTGPFAFTVGDASSTASSTRTTDASGDGTQVDTSLFTVSAPAVAADATLNNAGRIDGDATVAAGFGNATATITGTVGGSVNASAFASTSSSGSTSEYSVNGGLNTLTSQTFTDSFADAGGEANVVIDTAAALQGKGVPSVAGNVFASGVGGASITVGSGSVIGDAAAGTGGNLFANSLGESSSDETVTTYAADGFTPATVASTFSTAAVGGAASVTNNGTVLGDVEVQGLTSASLVNNGDLGTGGNLFSVSALDGNSTVTLSDTNPTNAGIRALAATVDAMPAGGIASFTNSGNAFGDVELEGLTGSFTNNGILTGSTTLGGSVFSGSATVDATINTTNVTVTPVAASQTYTVDQNGVSGGFNVTGAVSTQSEVASALSSLLSPAVPLDASQVDPAAFNLTVGGEAAIKTADIKSTINLNNGSITLGDIDAQRDDSGAFLTDTTVNLNGAGFLGASELRLADAATPANFTPAATLPEDAEGLFSPTAVRVLGVNTVNKTGAGTFVVTGAEYVPAEGSTPAGWTMDVGNFNVQAGEVQLDVAGADAVFGIKGNINNDATLVLGRRAPTFVQTVGNSIVTPGPEAIKGIELYQQGNYTQTANGTTVVGVNPSLVRFGNLSVNDGGAAPEVLGPITGGVSVPYFTTPTNAGVFSIPSSVTVDGNLNLAGKVAVTVSKDSLYSTGDGYTLFTYTGTGNVTATAAPTLSSQFVTFGLKHDATAKTVSIEATRNSYATGATNPNATSAAVGLDSALADVIARVKTDAAGGNGFASVTEIANAQDIANIAAGLDWRLNSAQAAQVFNELSSAEIYGSLAAVDQNAVFNTTVNRLAARRGYGEALGTQIWFNPSANFAKTGGTKSGASKIKTNSYGGAFGLDVAYQEDGAFGIGFGYGQHDVTAQGSPEKAQVRTYTIGAYATQGFGPFYGSFQAAYGFSKFEVERDLAILARTIEGDFKGKQLDASLELGYDFAARSGLVVTPYGKLALRRWSMNGFTEEGGAGIGLKVDHASKTVFSPVLGVKAGALLGDADGIAYRPYAKVQYSFQGSIGSDRTVQYLGGGDAFRLKGVDPDGNGLIELGVDASVNKRVNLFVSGGYGFGGHNSLGQVRGGISFGF
ncbi:autotransporter domain-containing protein [Sphingobium fuliginis]|uniref:autotransporter domain-containing protein n=1 Tax=Sphingobium fuliginis (strain ATCC 27551) TaxID=336203 RepID=UPI00102181F6|nr:autotransporter outer membrane beta-barrel domain-containing protein [Sphingobium fuliginis]RYL99643.1 autotransporter domain-containing protein [Sphingobium fuliginis]